MFSLLVQVQVVPERRKEFLAAIAANAEASVRDEPGCLRFDVCAVDSDPDRFVFYELYADEDAFAAHRASPHFADWSTAAAAILVPDSRVSTAGSVLFTHSAEKRA
ncbi:Quinol monooxygenase YgiN [Modestobacter sp. DSM 44400]|uniref:putative quinol monooxygenase n=1 Tax=Modestobacter sp. DSM 44400 TaxID=1550230 RepID=UPI00089C1FC4|nr:putative quinol monooxygenase [Modestobacter sp. DSM 44400]SDX92238.1 Quinol monooxygenase YgiN [Modestobacter sp. DSM 44400]